MKKFSKIANKCQGALNSLTASVGKTATVVGAGVGVSMGGRKSTNMNHVVFHPEVGLGVLVDGWVGAMRVKVHLWVWLCSCVCGCAGVGVWLCWA